MRRAGILLAFLLLAGSAAADCRVLNADIFLAGDVADCYIVNAPLRIDGRNHTLIGRGGIGIDNRAGHGLTVENLRLTNVTVGLWARGMRFSLLDSILVETLDPPNSYGIVLEQSEENLLQHSSIVTRGAWGHGIAVSGGRNNRVLNTSVRTLGQSAHGVFILSSRGNRFDDLSIAAHGDSIVLDRSSGNLFAGGSASGQEALLVLPGSAGNRLEDVSLDGLSLSVHEIASRALYRDVTAVLKPGLVELTTALGVRELGQGLVDFSLGYEDTLRVMEATITLFQYDPARGAWYALSNELDSVGNTVRSGNLSSPGLFVLLGEAPQPDLSGVYLPVRVIGGLDVEVFLSGRRAPVFLRRMENASIVMTITEEQRERLANRSGAASDGYAVPGSSVEIIREQGDAPAESEASGMESYFVPTAGRDNQTAANLTGSTERAGAFPWVALLAIGAVVMGLLYAVLRRSRVRASWDDAGSADAATLEGASTAESALELMAVEGSRDILVMQEGRALGILMRRTVVREVAAGRDPRSIHVRELVRPVQSVSPGASMRAVLRIAVRQAATPVRRGSAITGVLSRSEFLRQVVEMLSRRQFRPGEIPSASQARVYNYLTADGSQPMGTLVEKMVQETADCILVMDDAHVTGIITDRDILKEYLRSPSGLRSALAEHIMCKGVLTVQSADTALQAARELVASGVRRAPVLYKGKVVGIVTERSLLVALDRLL